MNTIVKYNFSPFQQNLWRDIHAARLCMIEEGNELHQVFLKTSKTFRITRNLLRDTESGDKLCGGNSFFHPICPIYHL